MLLNHLKEVDFPKFSKIVTQVVPLDISKLSLAPTVSVTPFGSTLSYDFVIWTFMGLQQVRTTFQ